MAALMLTSICLNQEIMFLLDKYHTKNMDTLEGAINCIKCKDFSSFTGPIMSQQHMFISLMQCSAWKNCWNKNINSPINSWSGVNKPFGFLGWFSCQEKNVDLFLPVSAFFLSLMCLKHSLTVAVPSSLVLLLFLTSALICINKFFS